MLEKLKNFCVYHLATGFGSGFSPIAPGTAGTIVGVILWHFFFPTDAALQLLFLILTTALAVYVSGWYAQSEGVKDPPMVVADEIVGFFAAVMWLPHLDWPAVIVAFLIFRAFDIWKPYPVKQLETLPGGFGIVLDDIMAGVYTNIIMQIWLRLL